MADSRNQMPLWQKQLIDAYEKTGRTAYVRRKKSGSFGISLDGREHPTVASALSKIERVLEQTPRTIWSA